MNETVQNAGRLSPEDRRGPMIEAARKSFEEKGFDGTSLDDIIAQVGGSRRNIYDMFGGKQGLLRAVVGQIISEISETSRLPDAATTEPRAWLVAVGTAFVRQMLQPEIIAVFRQFIAQGGADPEEAERLWQAGPARLQAAIANWLRMQHEAGILHVPDPEVVSRILPEMFRGSLQIEVLVGRRTAISDEDINQQVNAAVDLFLAGAERRHT